MDNKYLTYISDEHLIRCIQNLHYAYLEANKSITKKKFYKNKIDTIKMTFDSSFNEFEEEKLIKAEIMRQVDKSINNAIGTFHEEILGGIDGYERGHLDGYDIKATNNSLFADIKNKHNTMNSSSSESLFQKLVRFAEKHPDSTCYWVQVLAKKSFNEAWESRINGTQYSHPQVLKISGDRFYSLLTGIPSALADLYKTLPRAISEYLESSAESSNREESSTVWEEITNTANNDERSLIDQITLENFPYYKGFDEL